MSINQLGELEEAVNLVDASAEPQTVYLPPVTPTQSYRVTYTKVDATANAVTVVPGGDGSTIDGDASLILEAQSDSASFSRGAGDANWTVTSNTSRTDVSTHASATEVHGATGAIVGVDDLPDLLDALLPTHLPPLLPDAIETSGEDAPIPSMQLEAIVDDLGNRIVEFGRGAATPVNRFIIRNSGTGAAMELQADGTDTDIDIAFTPKGAGNVVANTGQILEGSTLVALNSGATIADAANTGAAIPANSVEIVAPTTAEFNALLAQLRTLVTSHNANVTKINAIIAAAETGRLLTP